MKSSNTFCNKETKNEEKTKFGYRGHPTQSTEEYTEHRGLIKQTEEEQRDSHSLESLMTRADYKRQSQGDMETAGRYY